MFTAKIFVNSHRNDILTLRIINNRKKTELALDVRMTQEELMDAMTENSRNPHFRSLIIYWQSIIEDIRLELQNANRPNEDVMTIRKRFMNAINVRKFGTLYPDTTLTKLIPSQEETTPAEMPHGSFVTFFTQHTNSYANRSTRESNLYTLSCMRRFLPDTLDKLNFEDINYALLSDFEKFMEKAGLSKNTRRIHFANIRAAINDAYKRELTDADPFRRFRLKTEKTAKRSMPVEELRKLFSYPAEPHAIYYRDMFKLIFMLIGINTVDLYGLKEITAEGRVEYKRAKTGRLYSIKIEPEALEIINRYRGMNTLLNIADKYKDHRYFRRDTNDALRLIGEVKRIGRGGKKEYKPLWPELTTYWARHSWATIAADLDIPDATISLAMGHAGENRVTDIYIRRNQKKVDEANRRVLDWVLYGKR